MRTINSTLTMLIVVSVIISTAGAADESLEKKLKGRLVCLCGTCPNLLLSECECGTASRMRAEVTSLLDDGLSSDQVMVAFVEKYGQKVLAAPPAEGFNLTVWILPIGAVFIVGLLILIVLKGWSKQQAYIGEPGARQSSSAEDDEYQKRINRELENF